MMTEVTIDEEFKVDVDELNHTLYRYEAGCKVIATGKYKGQLSEPKWVLVGYFPNLEQCLRKIVFLKSLTGEKHNLDEYITRLEKLND